MLSFLFTIIIIIIYHINIADSNVIFVSTGATYENALLDCELRGTILLTASNSNIDNRDECADLAASNNKRRVWIGLNLLNGDEWQWESGEEYSESNTNWVSSDPVGGTSCANLRSSNLWWEPSGIRNRDDCNIQLPYCCDPIGNTLFG